MQNNSERKMPPYASRQENSQFSGNKYHVQSDSTMRIDKEAYKKWNEEEPMLGGLNDDEEQMRA